MRASENIYKLSRTTSDCTNCRNSSFCLAGGLSHSDATALSQLVQRRVAYQRGAALAHQGDPASHFICIRTGSVKLVHRDQAGIEQVVGFAFPGDVLGIDAVGNGGHEIEIVALELTTACLIPTQAFLAQARNYPQFFTQLMGAANSALRSAYTRSTLIAEQAADSRLLAFFRMIGRINGVHGLSRTEFNLSMSRKDIASYLAMAVETVSRLLRRLEESGAITVSGRFVSLKQDLSESGCGLQNSVANQ